MNIDIEKTLDELLHNPKPRKGYLITIKDLETEEIKDSFVTTCFIGAACNENDDETKMSANAIVANKGAENLDIAITTVTLLDAEKSACEVLPEDYVRCVKVMKAYKKLTGK